MAATQFIHRVAAWPRMGTDTTTAATGIEALTKAGLLGWDVRKLDAYSFDPVTKTKLRNSRGVHSVRTHPRTGEAEILGTVGHGYHIIQNEELADTLDTITGMSGAHFETAGTYRHDRHVFVTMRLPEGFRVAGLESEAHNLFLVATNSHDGESAFEVMMTTVRLACANTLHYARNEALARWKVHHTASATHRIQEIREGLARQQRAAREFEKDAVRLLDTPMSDREFDQLITDTWGVIDEAKASTRTRANAERRRTTLFGLLHDAPTQEGIRETAWGGLQAITEYIDHYENPTGDVGRRRERAVIGTGYQRKGAVYRRLVRR